MTRVTIPSRTTAHGDEEVLVAPPLRRGRARALLVPDEKGQTPGLPGAGQAAPAQPAPKK